MVVGRRDSFDRLHRPKYFVDDLVGGSNAFQNVDPFRLASGNVSIGELVDFLFRLVLVRAVGKRSNDRCVHHWFSDHVPVGMGR